MRALPRGAAKLGIDFIRWFGRAGLISAGIALMLVGAVWILLERDIARDRERIQLLEAEIKQLEPQVADADRLFDAVRALLARKLVIETLQSDRYAVQLLEELARRRPAGTYLLTLRNAGRRFTLTGYASSERAAQAFQGSLAESPLFQEAQLAELRPEATPARPGYPLQFTLNMRLKDRIQ